MTVFSDTRAAVAPTRRVAGLPVSAWRRIGLGAALALALAAFALALVTPQILKFKNFASWTGGVQGILMDKPDAPWDLPLDGDQWLYFFCLALALPLFWAARNMVASRTGRAMMAIRDH